MRTSVPNTSGRWLLAVGALAIVLVYGLLLLARFRTEPAKETPPVATDVGPDLDRAVVPLDVTATPNPVTAGDSLTVQATCNDYASETTQRRGDITFAALDAIPVAASAWNANVFRQDIVVPADTDAGSYELVVRCVDRVTPPEGANGTSVNVAVQVTTTTTSTTTTSTTTTTTEPPAPSSVPSTTLVVVS